MKIVANSIEESIVIAEKVNEEFGKSLVNIWNEQMFWTKRSEFHLHLVPTKERSDQTKQVKHSNIGVNP